MESVYTTQLRHHTRLDFFWVYPVSILQKNMMIIGQELPRIRYVRAIFP